MKLRYYTDVDEGKQRGSHRWQKYHVAGREVYLGVSVEPQTAGHFLWILPPAREENALAQFEVWLHPAAQPPALHHLDAEDLVPTG
ncbi:hypothetical protein [Suttonella indologenes]|uniref:hypothetical protein n=1 Tax=Suttonella indologenes TaxID=13276 RepID=UPI000E1BC7EC|nr:hypothetical protein [Suttonella indologenes]